uniref:Uncharacterized protein n=1 Tax=Hemiselmis andersenii TaxID=464988 RepID=A0A6U2DKW3_HEMAN|mmetsp:Transcript_24479/g.56739  ORF Transcript_24479/g.56739 Transcript_24479/m.56739 type:complete len:290 (+) Transcript_24479:137-1006(+)|eukprot:CAMPEP_0172007804 /NCGR_PEP_ID=MMETSP1041-20130122/6311_1 /TAXON_ID=464988 /ORGANISM="Hemiselmis andersenii, Strain CCMP439" /LENGTH=289 /DNA_ID=CAMNT_0012661961 /DNA_START=137 /DNA_END=1006 /DNA_ORIENTATION=+
MDTDGAPPIITLPPSTISSCSSITPEKTAMRRDRPPRVQKGLPHSNQSSSLSPSSTSDTEPSSPNEGLMTPPPCKKGNSMPSTNGTSRPWRPTITINGGEHEPWGRESVTPNRAGGGSPSGGEDSLKLWRPNSAPLSPSFAATSSFTSPRGSARMRSSYEESAPGPSASEEVEWESSPMASVSSSRKEYNTAVGSTFNSPVGTPMGTPGSGTPLSVHRSAGSPGMRGASGLLLRQAATKAAMDLETHQRRSFSRVSSSGSIKSQSFESASFDCMDSWCGSLTGDQSQEG